MMKKLIAMMECAVLAGMLVCVSPLVSEQPAEAQWQIPSGCVPIGRGTGTGFLNGCSTTTTAEISSPGATYLLSSEEPELFRIKTGNLTTGVTSIFPTVGVSRIENVNDAGGTLGGQNASIFASSYSLPTQVGQVNTITAYAYQNGTGDSVAFTGYSEYRASGTGVAYGAFYAPRSGETGAVGSGAIGVQLDVWNRTEANAPYVDGIFTKFVGFDSVYHSETAHYAGAAFLARASNHVTVGAQWDTGLVLAAGGVITHGFLDDSSAVNSLMVRGSHSYGLNLKEGTYSQAPILLPNANSIKGRNAADGANISLLTLSSTNQIVLGDGSLAIVAGNTADNNTSILGDAVLFTTRSGSTNHAAISSEGLRLYGGRAVVLAGSSSGTLSVVGPAVAGTNTLTFPAGTTDFTATGGTGRFVKQASAGAAFTVSAPTIGEIAGLGTGIATALAVNTGAAGAPVLFNGALGTPSSGTVTNLTGTASININGTVGATTPAAGTFTAATANSFVPNLSTVPSNGLYLPAANTLGWAINSAAELQLTATALSPAVDGGNSLGTTALGWQNLFANTGFVLNIENGNWVATHTTGILTVGTGDLRVTTAGTNTASVVTVGGTQTLTAKTLTSPTIDGSPSASGATWSNLGTITTVDINGGTMDGVTVGGSSAAAGTFSALTSLSSVVGVSLTMNIGGGIVPGVGNHYTTVTTPTTNAEAMSFGDTTDPQAYFSNDGIIFRTRNAATTYATLGNATAVFNGYVQTGTTTVGSLPTCNSGTKGARHFVTDANATTFNSTAAGGGANNVPVTCNGTNWVIGSLQPANDNFPEDQMRKYA